MRLVRLLFGAVVLLVPVMLYAQAPPDSVMEVLRQKARPGMVGDYEANRKKHMAWHTAQKDPWTWEVFQIMTGPDTGGYVIASGDHQWKEMEDWVARFADADAGDSQATMGPNIASKTANDRNMVILFAGVSEGRVTFGAPTLASCARTPPAAVGSAMRDQLPAIDTVSPAA